MGQGTPIAPTNPLAGKRILIVEDEYFLADDLADEFRRLGADVIGPVSEVVEAQKALQLGRPIDAALLDINLRSEMIFPFARALRELDIFFIFTTGYDKTSIRPEFADVPLWEKPLDIRAFTEGVAELLKGRRSFPCAFLARGRDLSAPAGPAPQATAVRRRSGYQPDERQRQHLLERLRKGKRRWALAQNRRSNARQLVT
ncbi:MULTISPECIES: hypothetical protein [unclassified Bradyrhizobium]|nr:MULTISPECIES: hypothetical protein [unclassified Bradyrhizobium]